VGIADDLEQLSSLFDRGILSREQFDAAKARLLEEHEAPWQKRDTPLSAQVPVDSPTSASAAGAISAAHTDEPSLDLPIRQVRDRPDPARESLLARVLDFVRTNRALSITGALVAVILVAVLASQPSAPAPTVTASAPSQQTQAQLNVTRCITNMGDWIDEFERNYERIYRTFGFQSLEAQAIQELSTQYYSLSFQIGADRAIQEVHPRVVGVCSNNPEFAERIARFSPR
jgi:hypothetical protein